MPLSRYLKVFPDPDRPGRVLVFSTRRGSIVRLPSALLRGLEEGAPSLSEGSLAALRRVGVWVDDPEAEHRQVWGYLGEVNRVSPVLVAAVIVGMACNFACPYCYEGADKGPGAMDEATAEALVAYLLDRLGSRHERLLVDVYGGEPLLYLATIRSLASRLREGCANRGVDLELRLVTNGSRLTPDVLDALLPLGLKGAQVTLDGPPDLHDRSRPYRDGRGSFHDIVENLRQCAPRVPVGVGANLTRRTWRRFPELLDLLVAAGLGPDRVAQVRFSPVLPADGADPACGACASTAEPWVAEAVITLDRAVRSRGYRVPKLSPSPCMADLDHAITVNWDGTLTRCPALINRPEFVVGTLEGGISSGPDPFRVPRWERHAPCRECVYLPLCFGGCRYRKLLRDGTMEGVDCQRSFWDRVLEPLVVAEARAQDQKGPGSSPTPGPPPAADRSSPPPAG